MKTTAAIATVSSNCPAKDVDAEGRDESCAGIHR